jgi:hypothetical protein
MSRILSFAALAAVAACTPTLNWREVPVPAAHLKTMFPCKPDSAERTAQIAPGRSIVLHALGCEAGGVDFALVYGDARDGDVAATLAAWKKAALASIRAQPGAEQPLALAGASAATTVRASGQRREGEPVQSQAAYFARGSVVYQAAVYGEKLKPEMTEPFFSGLQLE